MTKIEKLIKMKEIRKLVRLPKNMGGAKNVPYKYRTVPSILTVSAKPLDDCNLILDIENDMTSIEGVIFAVVTAKIYDLESGELVGEAKGYAQNSTKIASMSQPQITSSLLTYASKIALTTLLQLDNDFIDIDQAQQQQQQQQQQHKPFTPRGQVNQKQWNQNRGYQNDYR